MKGSADPFPNALQSPPSSEGLDGPRQAAVEHGQTHPASVSVRARILAVLPHMRPIGEKPC